MVMFTFDTHNPTLERWFFPFLIKTPFPFSLKQFPRQSLENLGAVH